MAYDFLHADGFPEKNVLEKKTIMTKNESKIYPPFKELHGLILCYQGYLPLSTYVLCFSGSKIDSNVA